LFDAKLLDAQDNALRQTTYQQADVFVVWFPLDGHNDKLTDTLSNERVPEILLHSPGVPFLIVGILTADALAVASRAKLGVTHSERRRCAIKLGAVEYLECEPNVTMEGVQDVMKTVRDIFIPRLWNLLTKLAGSCYFVRSGIETSKTRETSPWLLSPTGPFCRTERTRLDGVERYNPLPVNNTLCIISTEL